MLELDILLVAFAHGRYPELSPVEQAAYHALLACDDWQIWDWLQGAAAPPPQLAGVVESIVRHAVRNVPGSNP